MYLTYIINDVWTIINEYILLDIIVICQANPVIPNKK